MSRPPESYSVSTLNIHTQKSKPNPGFQPSISVLPRSEAKVKLLYKWDNSTKFSFGVTEPGLHLKLSKQISNVCKESSCPFQALISQICTELDQALEVRATPFLKITTVTLGLDISKQAYGELNLVSSHRDMSKTQSTQQSIMNTVISQTILEGINQALILHLTPNKFTRAASNLPLTSIHKPNSTRATARSWLTCYNSAAFPHTCNNSSSGCHHWDLRGLLWQCSQEEDIIVCIFGRVKKYLQKYWRMSVVCLYTYTPSLRYQLAWSTLTWDF